MRNFNDSIKFSVVRENLEKNHGRICCENCGKELKSIHEGHFDHIKSFAKGGKSTKTNCQILCSTCNLKKNDKELNDFILDEKAKNFLQGISINEDINNTANGINNPKTNQNNYNEMTKEKFNSLILAFINKKGNIHKVDFKREYNHLPPIHYVYEYYGDFTSFKQSFNLKEQVIWNRETIKEALNNYLQIHGDILEKDLKSCNDLPSYPCLMKYYPEYQGLNHLKQDMFSLNVRQKWSPTNAIKAGKQFVSKNGKITLKDMTSINNLPAANVIYRYFGTMEKFQQLVGAPTFKRKKLITIQDIDAVVEKVFESESRIFDTRKDFFDFFPISESVIYRNFDSLDLFCEKYNIIIKKRKKAKFTKQEINDIILNYVKSGNPLPKAAKNLAKLGLPSRDAIMRYYEDWHEPFILYAKLCEKIK